MQIRTHEDKPEPGFVLLGGQPRSDEWLAE